jgi:hypothetical protein
MTCAILWIPWWSYSWAPESLPENHLLNQKYRQSNNRWHPQFHCQSPTIVHDHLPMNAKRALRRHEAQVGHILELWCLVGNSTNLPSESHHCLWPFPSERKDGIAMAWSTSKSYLGIVVFGWPWDWPVKCIGLWDWCIAVYIEPTILPVNATVRNSMRLRKLLAIAFLPLAFLLVSSLALGRRLV